MGSPSGTAKKGGRGRKVREEEDEEEFLLPKKGKLSGKSGIQAVKQEHDGEDHLHLLNTDKSAGKNHNTRSATGNKDTQTSKKRGGGQDQGDKIVDPANSQQQNNVPQLNPEQQALVDRQFIENFFKVIQKRKTHDTPKYDEVVSSSSKWKKQLEQARQQQQIKDAARAERGAIQKKGTNLFSIESPFTQQIEDFPKPDKFKVPKLDKYDGTKDPEDHLYQYLMHMSLHEVPDEMRCKAFPLLLTGTAWEWFKMLPPGSISDFGTLARKFTYAFITYRPFPMTTNLFSFESPFTRQIEDFPKPDNFKVPKLDSYDGTEDPEDHLHRYLAHMKLDEVPDEMRCKAFPVLLTGKAREWFKKLPPRSISNFGTLARKFAHAFITSKPIRMSATHLFTIKQKKDETVLVYFKRFNEESRLVRGADEHLVITAFVAGLKPGELYAKLYRKLPGSMVEFVEAVHKYCRGEEAIRLRRESERQV